MPVVASGPAHRTRFGRDRARALLSNEGMHKKSWRLVALGGVLLAPSLALALPTFSLVLARGDAQNNFNVPQITLTNTSTAGEQIVGFSFTIGAPGFVWDFVLGAASNPAGQAVDIATEALTGATLVAGDRVNGSGSVTTLVWSFTHFAPGESLVFEVDVDPVSGGPTVDARTVWFNNGAAPNAQIQITYGYGATSSFTLADGPIANSYPLNGTAVPEPGVALLVGAGLALLAASSRRAAAAR